MEIPFGRTTVHPLFWLGARFSDMLHVLIADDTPGIRRLLRHTLTPQYAISEATDGVEALTQLRAGRHELAILDVSMPGLDGLAVCRQIRAERQLASTIVIVTTADSVASNEGRALQAGADAFVAKPFSPSRLIETVEALVRERLVMPEALSTERESQP